MKVLVATKKRVIKHLIVCLFLVLVTFTTIIVQHQTAPVATRGAGFHVVVDAGHGGRDGGAVSPSGTREADINLAISKALAFELESRGIGVTMTRTTQDSLASPFARNRKRDDMTRRNQIINNVQPDLIVSIHLNSFMGDRSVRGLQSFYAKESEVSRHFAIAIQHQFNNSTLITNRRATSGDFYMLTATSFPAVLVECGFLSNPQEERLLRQREYQHIVAAYIATAIQAAVVSAGAAVNKNHLSWVN